ncbi:General transcription factor IIF subunit 2 [Nymphon striatum]|nr:General transcription factor IIF subunit 2 [Nymphon striatum]
MSESMEVDCKDAPRKVWLVKVPKYIHTRWQKAPKSMNAGKLRISKLPNGKPDVTFSLSEEMMSIKDSNDITNIPKEHKFVITNIAKQTLAAFSELQGTIGKGNKNGQESKEGTIGVKLEGQVIQRAECKPVVDAKYMQLKKDHILKACQPLRTVKKIDGVVNNFKPISNHQFIIESDKKKKETGKKSRDAKDKVMDMLFSAFEKHQYYNIRDLEQITRQPLPYLKEILKEICNYNVKNPHKNMWELKPEYRHYKEPGDAGKS